MRKEVTETGKTLEDAINSACEQLGISREDSELEIEVIDRPKKGFLGIKNTPARVRVSVEVPDEKPAVRAAAQVEREAAQKGLSTEHEKKKQVEKQAARATPAVAATPVAADPPVAAVPKEIKERKEQPPKPKVKEEPTRASKKEPRQSAPVPESEYAEKEKLACDYLKDVLGACGLSAEFKVTRDSGGTFIDISGEGLGLIIGRRGETLDALQYLAGLVANRGDGDYLRLTVDCGEYRLKRKDTLEELAKRLANQVLKTNTSKALEPMNPFERRIIHATVSEIEGVTSSSVGEEPGRRVIITTPTAKPGRPPRPERRGQGYSSRPRREGPGREDGERPPRREGGDRDRGRDDRRRGGRGDRDRGGRPRRESAPVPQGPPKQTPEAEAMSSVRFGKIDLE